MSFESSVILVLVVIAAMGVLAFAVVTPHKRRRRKDAPPRDPNDPLSGPPTVTHYGHA